MAGGNSENNEKQQPAAAAGTSNTVAANLSDAARAAERMREARRIQLLILRTDNALRNAQRFIDECKNDAAKDWLMKKKRK